MVQKMSDDLEGLMDRHAKFLKRTLYVLPDTMAPYDLQRMTIVYFAVSGLDVLNRLDTINDLKEDIVNWVYTNLINCDIDQNSRCGFRGSSTFKLETGEKASHMHDYSHIAMTYTALCILVILGDDLSRINRENFSKSLQSLQLPSGSFKAAAEGGEDDMRFIYCATTISTILNIKTGINKEKAVQYILSSITYEGGIAQGPWLEAHGGSTYCAVATLDMLGCLDTLTWNQRSSVVRWLVNRQHQGFNGRPDKDDDTCYTFWIGAALDILKSCEFVNWSQILEFVLTTSDAMTGGFGKWADSNPDPLHTYLGWSGLAIGAQTLKCEDPGSSGSSSSLRTLRSRLLPVDPALNITKRARTHLDHLHAHHLHCIL